MGLVEPGVLYRIRVAAICGNVISDQQQVDGYMGSSWQPFRQSPGAIKLQ